ncbi:toll/interleukin-1 receptor domain-containing protein [Candidatus Accumulibacter phosphatis]|uniref:Toll/interleukin-1 receptor domain-containing protein n=1 Tax=Candidatus Accumulibacter phosphatis TaxID=327160 RepID=A0ABX1TY59_9PROT|nr:toll/interleukin-1 receptor domain-containing protein [Candidatus Accumulibacter phosphatis]NMQ27999.1 toll/interleukin-1 receptor domain-containing protein [Candidatus Accumulibacter phosphatis]
MKVFISYAGKDREFADRLVGDLDRSFQGNVHFLNDKLIQPGGSLADSLNAAIAAVDVMLLVVSPAYLESPWMKKRNHNWIVARQLRPKIPFYPSDYKSVQPT